MAANPLGPGPQPAERISSLLEEYFARRQAGEKLTPEQFAAEHPRHTDDLRPYLEGLALVHAARTRALASAATPASRPAVEFPTVAGYELLEELGRGGMGVVYRALQLSTKRVVALKVMLAGPFASDASRRRFDREVELAARFQHPYIVRILESGATAGRRYYAMDYVRGLRLDRYLAEVQPDIRSTLNLFVEMCAAVEHAHGHGVVHRDLKPGNVLVDKDGHPHILDFGLAKATDQPDADASLAGTLSSPGQVLGTLFYLSPEQAAGTPAEIDARTDVYALGLMLYEALTGALPFDTTGRPSDIIQRILDRPPVRPSTLAHHVDRDLETIVLTAMEKDKPRRYPSARDLADDLRRYLAGDPIHARPPSRIYVLRKRLIKHRLAVGITAATVALALIVLLAALSHQRRQVAGARRSAVVCLANLESGAAHAFGPAEALYQQFPQLPEARLLCAQAYYRTPQMRNSAIGFLESELQRDPSQYACRALLAEIYQASGDPNRAAALEAQAERDAPDTAEGWYLRSFAALSWSRALQCAEAAIQRDPRHILAWCRATGLRLKTDDLDGTFQGAARLIELGDPPFDWLLLQGHVLARQGRFSEAVAQYTRAAAASPSVSPPRRYRAHMYRRLKDYPAAIADYTQALALDGEVATNVWDFYQRATPLWILGRADEALADYRRVRILAGRPLYSDARQFFILRELGRDAEAQEVLAAALHDVREPWLRDIFRCLAGRLTPADLIAIASESGSRGQLSEAYYYAGEVALLADQLTEARAHFEACVHTRVQFDLNVFPLAVMNEYELAQWRLDTRLADVQPTSRP